MKNIYKLIEHLVNNWPSNLSEALAPRVKQQLMDKFKQDADDYKVKISDKNLSDYIDYFDTRLKNNPKVTEKDIFAYVSGGPLNIKDFIKLVSPYKGSSKEDEDDDTSDIPDVVYNENGLIIYSGHNEENCLKFGKGEEWCITKGSFGNYRYDLQRKNPTFYLVKDTNLPNNDRKSFFVIVVGSDNTYKASDKSNNDVGGRASEWNRWEPWSFIEQNFPSVQGLQRIFKYVPISRIELSIRQYANRPMDVEEWEIAPPDFKERYLIIRKGKDELFDDITNEKFVKTILPDNQDMATVIAKNYGMIDLDILLEEFDSFTPQNQKSIIANARKFTKISTDTLKSRSIPFSAKKAVVKGELLNVPSDERYYVSSNDKAIIKLKFIDDDISMGLFTEKSSSPNVNLNTRTSSILRGLPRFDEIPFDVLLKLTKDNLLPKDTINKIIEKSKETNSKSAIISANTDEGEIVLDTNTFKAYKPEDGEYKSVPFEDESVQSILKSDTVGSGIQDNIVKVISKFNNISIPMSTVASIIKQAPVEKRIVKKEDKNYVIIPSNTQNELNLWDTNNPLDKISIAYRYKSNGGIGSDKVATQEMWSEYFNYLRSQNIAYNPNQLLGVLQNGYYTGEKFAKADPPLTEDNLYKIVEYEGVVYLVNKTNPRESKQISPQTDKLIRANIPPSIAARMLGTRLPARSTAAAPVPAQGGGQDVANLITQAGLTTGFEALPTGVRNRLINGNVTPVNTDRGATRRNGALGARGRVTGVITAGQSKFYVIRLASGTIIGSVAMQPDAQHYIVTTQTAFRIPNANALIDALQRRNIAEEMKAPIVHMHAVTRPQELEEIKYLLQTLKK